MYKISSARGRYDRLMPLLFVLGGLLAGCYENETRVWMERLPVAARGCMACLLLLDALLVSSPLAQLPLLGVTFVFGAMTAMTGKELIALGFPAGKRELTALLTAVPMHFVLGVWGMRSAAGLRALMHGRKGGGRYLLLSAVMAVSGLLVSAWVMSSILL